MDREIVQGKVPWGPLWKEVGRVPFPQSPVVPALQGEPRLGGWAREQKKGSSKGEGSSQRNGKCSLETEFSFDFKAFR